MKKILKNLQTNTLSEEYNYQTGHTKLVSCNKIKTVNIIEKYNDWFGSKKK